MYFAHFELILLLFTVKSLTLARKIRIYRHTNGIDHFEVLGDGNESICTSAAKAVEFCAELGASSVNNTKACPRESLHCRCNSTKSTFLLQAERCVKQEDVARYLNHGTTFPGRSSVLPFLHIKLSLLYSRKGNPKILFFNVMENKERFRKGLLKFDVVWMTLFIEIFHPFKLIIETRRRN